MGANQGRPGDAPSGGGKRSKASKAGKAAKGKGGDEMTIAGQAVSGDKIKPSLSRQVSGAPTPLAQPNNSKVTSGEGAQQHHHPPAAAAAVVPPPATAAAPAADPEFDAHSHPFHAPLDHVREEERPLQDLARVTHFDMVTLRKLQIIFTDIAESDVDDGIIDGNELTDAMGLKSSCLLARTIFRIFDIGQNKKIDFGQWVKTISALSADASLEEKIKFSFGLYDLNGDGSIDVEELRAMLEAAVKDENVLNLSDAEVSDWCAHTLSLVDRDGNGKVDYEEYRSMVRNSTKFLESFTLDITALTKSFKFKSKNSTEKLTAGEMDQRLHWFRARQRQYSSRSSKDTGNEGSSSTQHGNQANPNQHPNPLSNQGRGHTHTHATNDQETPAQRNSVAAGTPAQPSHHGLVPTATGVAASAAHAHGGSGRVDIKGGSGSYKPIVVTVATPPLNLAPMRSASAQSSTGSEGPTFHDAEPTPSPAILESSPIVHPQPPDSSAVAPAAAASSPAANAAAFPASTTSASDPVPSLPPAASPTLRLDTSDSEPVAPAAATSSPQAKDERETAEARANFRRHHSDPNSSAGSHSVHYTASRTPIHLLRLASVATMAGGEEVLEDDTTGGGTPNPAEDKQ